MSKKEISQIEQEEGIGEEIDIDTLEVEEADGEQITALAADEEDDSVVESDD